MIGAGRLADRQAVGPAVLAVRRRDWLVLGLEVVLAAAVGVVVASGGSDGPLVATALAALPAALAVVAWADRPVRGALVVLAAHVIGVLLFVPGVASERARASLVSYGLVVTLATVVAVLSLRSSRWGDLDPAVRATVVGCLTLAGLGAVVGFGTGNPFEYLASDVGKVVISGLLVAVAAAAGREATTTTILAALGVAVLAMQVRDVLDLALTELAGQSRSLTQPLWMHNVVGIMALGGLALSRATRASLAPAAGIAFLLLMGLASAFRSYLAVLGMLACLPFLVRPGRVASPILRRVVALLAVVSLVVTAVAWVSPAASSTLTSSLDTVESRFQLLSADGQDDVSGNQRLYEAGQVAATLRTAPGTILSGQGAGALIELDERASTHALARNDETKHHIHITPVAMLHRFGLPGIIGYLALAGVLVVRATRILRREEDPREWVLPLAVLGFLAADLFFLTTPGDVVFAAAAGVVLVRGGRRADGAGSGDSPIGV